MAKMGAPGEHVFSEAVPGVHVLTLIRGLASVVVGMALCPTAEAQPLQTGGLAPPTSPQQPTHAEAHTVQTLQAAEHKDAGRRLEFVWVDGRVGYERLWLQALSDGDLLDPAEHGDAVGGLSLQGAAGVRLIFLTAGARYRRTLTDDFEFWSLGVEGGLHWPMGRWEPSVTAEVGYAALDGLSSREGGVSLKASGVRAGVIGTLDWYLDPLLSLGAYLDSSYLYLSREAGENATTPSYTTSGSASGLSLGAGVRAGFHF